MKFTWYEGMDDSKSWSQNKGSFFLIHGKELARSEKKPFARKSWKLVTGEFTDDTVILQIFVDYDSEVTQASVFTKDGEAYCVSGGTWGENVSEDLNTIPSEISKMIFGNADAYKALCSEFPVKYTECGWEENLSW